MLVSWPGAPYTTLQVCKAHFSIHTVLQKQAPTKAKSNIHPEEKRVMGTKRQSHRNSKGQWTLKRGPTPLELRHPFPTPLATFILPNYSTFSQTFLRGTQPLLHIQSLGSLKKKKKKLPKPELHLRLSESDSRGTGTQEIVCLQALPSDLKVQSGFKATAKWNLALLQPSSIHLYPHTLFPTRLETG